MNETIRQGTSAETTIGFPLSRRPLHDYVLVMATPWSGVKLGICADDAAISAIDFLTEDAMDVAATSPVAEEALRQLHQYFRDPRWRFTLPLAPHGTTFQLRVWDALRQIPAGATSSYGAVARRLQTSARAVGGACRSNPIPLIIPCHRVVSAQGMGGFMGVTAGRGLYIKQSLLMHESPS